MYRGTPYLPSQFPQRLLRKQRDQGSLRLSISSTNYHQARSGIVLASPPHPDILPSVSIRSPSSLDAGVHVEQRGFQLRGTRDGHRLGLRRGFGIQRGLSSVGVFEVGRREMCFGRGSDNDRQGIRSGLDG